MRTMLIAGNWKMHLTRTEAVALAEHVKHRVGMRSDIEVLVCPSHVNLHGVGEMLRGGMVKLGAQDVFWLEEGAFTGQVSPLMLASIGCEYVILGHSETRGRFGQSQVPENLLYYFSETDETINLKIQAILPHGLKPILCVGETLAEREAEQTDATIQTQLQGALAGLEEDELYDLVIAYEPVWAIGTGKVCEPDEANRICGLIRKGLEQLYSAEMMSRTRILYGGSVKASNAATLLQQPEVDGALVGGASLKAEEFLQITYCVKSS
jgi:triosephosphate isomerase